jgi:hypothetical protein
MITWDIWTTICEHFYFLLDECWYFIADYSPIVFLNTPSCAPVIVYQSGTGHFSSSNVVPNGTLIQLAYTFGVDQVENGCICEFNLDLHNESLKFYSKKICTVFARLLHILKQLFRMCNEVFELSFIIIMDAVFLLFRSVELLWSVIASVSVYFDPVFYGVYAITPMTSLITQDTFDELYVMFLSSFQDILNWKGFDTSLVMASLYPRLAVSLPRVPGLLSHHDETASPAARASRASQQRSAPSLPARRRRSPTPSVQCT